MPNLRAEPHPVCTFKSFSVIFGSIKVWMFFVSVIFLIVKLTWQIVQHYIRILVLTLYWYSGWTYFYHWHWKTTYQTWNFPWKVLVNILNLLVGPSTYFHVWKARREEVVSLLYPYRPWIVGPWSRLEGTRGRCKIPPTLVIFWNFEPRNFYESRLLGTLLFPPKSVWYMFWWILPNL